MLEEMDPCSFGPRRYHSQICQPTTNVDNTAAYTATRSTLATSSSVSFIPQSPCRRGNHRGLRPETSPATSKIFEDLDQEGRPGCRLGSPDTYPQIDAKKVKSAFN